MERASFAESVKNFLRRIHLMPLMTTLGNFWFFWVKKWAKLRNKNPLEVVYNDNFFSLDRHEVVLKDTPKILAEIITSLYHPKNVVDFGCGCAIYLREFEKLGAEVMGLDGSPAAVRNFAISKDKFLLQDLTLNFSLPRRYDCAICFEVAEHIPTLTSATLVENITKASDLIVFTAADEGQGGHDHINEQSPEFWISLFAERGYAFLKEDTEKVRKMLTDRGAIFWLAQNALIFKKRS